MTVRRLHRRVGLLLLLPCVAWAATGVVFFVKPGYGGAYETLAVKAYPIAQPLAVTPPAEWREFRVLQTVLGAHLVARTDAGWRQLDPATLQPVPSATDRQLRSLVEDAFTANPARYGRVLGVDGNVVETDTGVRVTVDWSRLTLQQRGRDTALIDALYRVHYVQWTGLAGLDRALGLTALVLLTGLTALGGRLMVKR